MHNIDRHMIGLRRRRSHRPVWLIARSLHMRPRPIYADTIPKLIILRWLITAIGPRNDIPVPPSPASADGGRDAE